MVEKEIEDLRKVMETKLDALAKCIDSLTNLYNLNKEKIDYLMKNQTK